MEQDRYRAWLAPLCAPQPDVGMVPDYVPATEEQLRLTEARLGFALLVALRAVYALVANGGDLFCDGYVLYGSVGGYPRDASGAPSPTAQATEGGKIGPRSSPRVRQAGRLGGHAAPGAQLGLPDGSRGTAAALLDALVEQRPTARAGRAPRPRRPLLPWSISSGASGRW